MPRAGWRVDAPKNRPGGLLVWLSD